MTKTYSKSRRVFIQQTAVLTAGSMLAACAPQSTLVTTTPSKSSVEYRFYRNATAKMTYAGLTFLLDPMLSAKGELPSFAGIAPNPTVDLPVSPDEIIADIDVVIVSHMHEDHFDDAAADILDKTIPIITPRNSAPISPRDVMITSSHKQRLHDYGFANVREINEDGTESITFGDVTLTQVWARHGKGHVGELMGGVNGIIFAAANMPTIYWAGDTILDAGQMNPILAQYKPDIVIAHTGGPIVEALSPEVLLMNSEQGLEFIKMANRYNPNVEVIAIHMESLDHCFSTRADLQALVSELDDDIAARVHIPTDGQVLAL